MGSLASLRFCHFNSLIYVLGLALFLNYVLWTSSSRALSLLALKTLVALCAGPAIAMATRLSSLLRGSAPACVSHGISSSPGRCAPSPRSRWSCFSELQVHSWEGGWVSDPIPRSATVEAPNCGQKCFQFYLWMSGLLSPCTMALAPCTTALSPTDCRWGF